VGKALRKFQAAMAGPPSAQGRRKKKRMYDDHLLCCSAPATKKRARNDNFRAELMGQRKRRGGSGIEGKKGKERREQVGIPF